MYIYDDEMHLYNSEQLPHLIKPLITTKNKVVNNEAFICLMNETASWLNGHKINSTLTILSANCVNGKWDLQLRLTLIQPDLKLW